MPPNSASDKHVYMKQGSREYILTRSGIVKKIVEYEMSTENPFLIYPEIVAQFMCAARNNELEVVREFVALGYPVDLTDEKNRSTALHVFAGYGHRNAVEFLVESGANPLIEDVYQNTPSLVAIDCGYIDVSMYLAQKEGERLRGDYVYA
jgi:hypothetical protein